MKDSMIDDVIKDVRSGEEKAESMIEEARQRGKDIVLAAQADADKRRADAKLAAKQLRQQYQLETAQRAAERREALMRRGELAAKELTDSKNSAVEEAADAVVQALAQSYKQQL